MNRETALNGCNIETEDDGGDAKEIHTKQLDTGDKKRSAVAEEDIHDPQDSQEIQQDTKRIRMIHDGDGDATVILSDTSSHQEHENKIPPMSNAANTTMDLNGHDSANGGNDTDEFEIHKDNEEKCSELGSACSSPLDDEPSSNGAISDKDTSGNESVGSGGSVASSSSASSYHYPPAPPSTPISYGYKPSATATGDAGKYKFQDVVTPKPPSDYTKTIARPVARKQGASGNFNSTQDQEMNASSGRREQREYDKSDDFYRWKVGPRYELMRILGRGSYGEVAQARDLNAIQSQRSGETSPKFVAIKRIATAFEQEIDALRFFREIHLLRRLKGHDCIIQLIDIIAPENESVDDLNDLYLVFEYVDTDLYKLIMSPQYLTTAHIRTFLYQMLKALKYLHSSSVIHRDLKPANILLNEDCSLKICDFGLARIVSSDQVAKSSEENSSDSSKSDQDRSEPKQGLTRQLTKHVVTRWYRSPELILIQPYTTAVDIWSVGCIFAELLSMQEESVPSYEDRMPLFPGGSCFPLSGGSESKASESERLDQLSVILSVIGTPSDEDVASIGNANEYIKSLKKSPHKSLESMYPGADSTAIDLLKKMLQFNPSKRCTADEALQHEFLKGVRQVELERVSDGPLVGPDFLNSNKISIEEIKRRTFDEVMWFKQFQPPMVSQSKAL